MEDIDPCRTGSVETLPLLEAIKQRNQEFLDVVNDMNRERTFAPWYNPIDPLDEELAEMHTRVEIKKLGHRTPTLQELNEDPMYKKILHRNQVTRLEKPFNSMKVAWPEEFSATPPNTKWQGNGGKPRGRKNKKTPISEVPPVANLFNRDKLQPVTPFPGRSKVDDDIHWLTKDEHYDLLSKGILIQDNIIFGPDGQNIAATHGQPRRHVVLVPIYEDYDTGDEEEDESGLYGEEEVMGEGEGQEPPASPPPCEATPPTEDVGKSPVDERRPSQKSILKGPDTKSPSRKASGQSRKKSTDVDAGEGGVSPGEEPKPGDASSRKSSKAGQSEKQAPGSKEPSRRESEGAKSGQPSEVKSQRSTVKGDGEEEAAGGEETAEKSVKSEHASQKGDESHKSEQQSLKPSEAAQSEKEGSQKSGSKRSASAASGNKSPEKTEDEEETQSATKSEKTETSETPATEGDEEATEAGTDAGEDEATPEVKE